MHTIDRYTSFVRGTPGNRILAALGLVIGLIGLLIAAAAHAQAPLESVEGELLVGLRAGVVPQQVN